MTNTILNFQTAFAQNLNFYENQLEKIFSLPLTEVLNLPELQQELNSLDTNLLKKTLPAVGGVLARELLPSPLGRGAGGEGKKLSRSGFSVKLTPMS